MSEVKTRFPQITIPSRFPIIGNKDSEPQPIEEVITQKLNKKDVAYESPAKGMSDCDECIHFDPCGSCYLVTGLIKPDDWCNRFVLDPTKENIEEE